MSAMTFDSQHREMVFVPSEAGFTDIISAFWYHELTRQLDCERRRQREWDQRKLEN